MKSIVRSGLVLFLSLAMVHASFALPRKTGDDDDIDDLIIEREGGGETVESRRDGLAGADDDSTPTRQSPAEDEVPPKNCGTHWTEWEKSPEGLNACPDHCQPSGEPLVQSQKPAGSGETLYRARNSCVWKPSIEADMTRKLTQPIPASANLQNCGTAWTDWLENPEGVNPCSDNCGPVGVPLVYVSRFSSDEPLKYSVRYQCYRGIQMAAAPQTPPEERPTGRLGSRNNFDNATVKPVSEEPAPQISAPDRPSGGFGNTGRIGTADATPEPDSYNRFAGTRAADVSDRPLAVADTGQPGPVIAGLRTISNTSIEVDYTQKSQFDSVDHRDDPAWSPSAWEIVSSRVGTNTSRTWVREEIGLDGTEPTTWRLTGQAGHFTPSLEYDVWVSTVFKDGSRKSSDPYRVRMPEAVNPSDFSAKPYGPNSARLTWSGLPGAAYYFVEGSHLERVKVTDEMFTVPNLPPGNHEWRLMAAFGEESVYNHLDPSVTMLTIAGAGATGGGSAPTGSSGRYRISVVGFTANRATYDNPLQIDGKGDEVFLSAAVQIVDATGNSTTGGLDASLRSHVYGDRFFQDGRRQAGSLSGEGGIRSGDSYPQAPWAGTPSTDDPLAIPMALWSGMLTDGSNAVIVTPTLWEYDGSGYANAFQNWVSWSGRTLHAISNANLVEVAGWKSPVQLNLAELGAGLTIDFQESIIGTDGDRPIGMQLQNGRGVFVPKSIALTYAAAESVLANQIGSLPLGVYPVQYQDDAKWWGDYTLYIKIERLN